MKNITLALLLAATATLTAAACGDSESDSGDAGDKGGSSGTGGASGASGTSGSSGTSTTGGTGGTTPTGGTGGTAPTGGTTSGGTSGAAGAGADGGVGAEGGMGAEGGIGASGGDGPGPGAGCPGTEPMAMTMCTTRGLSCDFGDRVCRCNLNTGSWNCFDENDDCPTAPDPNGDCSGGQTACSYGDDGTCVCVQGNFTCDSGVVSCPAMQPMDGASCNMFPAGFDCSYSAGDCSCMAGGGGGAMRDWNCQDSACPAMAPNSGGTCSTPGLICDYTTPGPAADPTCVCNTMSSWTCL